ncbi:MAG TPA: adenylate/guanylate cyclase domain-containing protein [Candidatus Eremiobacteraceae bacterium]|nr:adenylate/guanylate cyclase domain-containing protein [Candidatus Eremiobacteraceae bacterium]
MTPRPRVEQPTTSKSGPAPTGTLTFLFSDIEGSTRRWELHRENMKAAIARHEELMQSAIAQQHGYVFKMVGDEFCCAFSTAHEALRAALDAQRALADEDFSAVDGLRVRMGVHTGNAQERDGDYFGPAVNRVARLMSVGHGGQVLLSGGTYELVRNDAPPDTAFTDLGLHRFKDLAQPEHVWQAAAGGIHVEFPPLRSLDTLPNNLPMQVTSFHGRENDVAVLKEELTAHRLITLLGPGGVGKTRLAVQVGADLLDRFPDGVWICDLAPIRDPQSVSSVVAKSLGISQLQGPLSDDAIAQWLRHKQLLLILDDCEHVLDTIAALADAIHRGCPDIRLLATSRQALGVGGEKVVPLASLAVPEQQSDLAPAQAIQFGAVALFVDRALLVDQSFRLDDRNAAMVAEICRRLDGIPLAIELAAARVKVMSIATLAQRLDERFKLLTAGSRTALPRQKTLSALIDWSYDLLSQPESVMFNRLAVFAGSFSLDAATQVCAGDGIDEADALDLLCSLADKSLVVVDTHREQERYRLLESTRQYGLEKLMASGERDRLERRYAEYYLGVAQDNEKSQSALPLSEWLATVERELANFRAVLEWALGKSRDATLGSSLAAALEMFWWHGGVEAEGRRWINAALNQIDRGTQPDVVARLTQALALLTSRMLFS